MVCRVVIEKNVDLLILGITLNYIHWNWILRFEAMLSSYVYGLFLYKRFYFKYDSLKYMY